MFQDRSWLQDFEDLELEQQREVVEWIQLLKSQQALPASQDQRLINQGDLFWAQIEKSPEPKTGLVHPHIILQEDLFNHSRIETVIVCALTSNKKRAKEPGNVLLEAGEGNLPKASVIVVSQISTVKKTQLGEYIGTLSPERVSQIFAGILFQQRAYFTRSNP